MTMPLLVLFGFVLWTILLSAGGLLIGRVYLAFVRGVPMNAWSKMDEGRGDDPDPPLMKRLRRARANCVENLPIVAPVLLTGAMLGVTTTTFDNLAIAFLVLRIGQSTVHVISTSATMVFIRAGLYVPQLLVCAWMAAHIYYKAPPVLHH